MKQNMGGIDRGLRMAVGVALMALAASGTIGAWGWIGVLPFATGLIGWCPAYLPFGWSTCRTR